MWLGIVVFGALFAVMIMPAYLSIIGPCSHDELTQIEKEELGEAEDGLDLEPDQELLFNQHYAAMFAYCMKSGDFTETEKEIFKNFKSLSIEIRRWIMSDRTLRRSI